MMAAMLSRVSAIAAKEFAHIRRDPRTLIAVLIVPIMQLMLFSYAISFDVKAVPTVVLDQDGTSASRAYLQTYRSSDFFAIKGSINDLASVDEAFRNHLAQVAVVVPPGFGRSLAKGEKAQVFVIVDGTEPNAAQLGQAYTVALNQLYDNKVLVKWADRQGFDTTQLGRIEPRIRTWYNPERKSADFLIPGLMVVIIMIVTVQQTAVTLVRERDLGTEEQMMVSPLRLPELMFAKLLPWTLLAFVDMVVIALVGLYYFHVPLRGSVMFLSVSAGFFVFASLGLGLIISAIAPSMESANIIAIMVAFLPAFLLSGFAFPLESIPPVLQGVSYLFPARYMIVISRGVFLKGAGFNELWPQLALLGGYSLLVIALASVLYGRRAAR
ncbi:MAG: ABC transporter permease [Coriobacteriia bacterium]|jgi:ABC-2 type transport system permease protein|nr:ABC transporter permease [Coriobacteriia bacterium]